MKNFKFLMTLAVIMSVTIFSSCTDKEPVQKPTVEISKIAADVTSVTVKVNPVNAMECCISYITKGESEPDAAYILANGTKLSATEATEYKIENLTQGTTYVVYAAVRADNQTAVSSIEVATEVENVPVVDAQFSVSFNVQLDMVDVSVVPQDKTKPYFYFIMEKELYESAYNADAALAAQSDITKIINEYLEFAGGTPADALAEMLLVDESTSSFLVFGNRQYICYVCYTDPQEGTVLGNVEIYEFAGPEIAASSNTFTIEVLNTTFRSIEYAITPSNDDKYSFSLITKEEFDQQPVEEYIDNMMAMNGMFMPATNGYFSNLVEYLMSDTEYVLLVFGYQSGVCTTEPTVEVIRTKPQGDGSKCTFEVEIEPINRYQLSYNITPSDNDVTYYYDICLGNETADEIKATLDAAIDEQISMGWLSSRAEYFSMWSSFGYTSDQSLVKPNSDGYKAYAVAINSQTGDYAGDFFFSDVCFMPEFTASPITVGCNVDKYFDGSDLAELMPMFYAGWGEELVFFTPQFTFENGEPVTYYYQIYQYDPAYEDHSTYNEDWAIPALIDMGYNYPDGELSMPWGAVGYLMCVAMDGEGNFSQVYRQKIEFDRENAAPAEEHPYYTPEAQQAAPKNAARAKEKKQPVKISTIRR